MNAKEFYEKFIVAMREENIATNEQIKKTFGSGRMDIQKNL